MISMNALKKAAEAALKYGPVVIKGLEKAGVPKKIRKLVKIVTR